MDKAEQIKTALSLTPSDYPNRDRIEVTLQSAVELRTVEVIAAHKLLIVTQSGKGGYHSMLYPCDESGAVTSWARETFYAGNGESLRDAIHDVFQAAADADKADYPLRCKVQVLRPHKWRGIKGVISEIYERTDVQAQMGRRYHVEFYDDNNNLHGYGAFRQSQLELIENSPVVAQGE